MTDRPAFLPPHPNQALPARSMPPGPGPDTLSDVLRTVRLTGSVFFLSEISSPCDSARVAEGTSLAPALAPRTQNVISYHVVAEGACWAGLYEGDPVRLEAGDVLVFPHGDSYYIGLDREMPGPPNVQACVGYLSAISRGQLPFVLTGGGGGPERAKLVCGFLGCDQRPFNPLLDSLPRLMIVRGGKRPAGDRLDRLIELALAEAREQNPGGESVRLRLSELVFVEAIRRHLATMPQGESGWLAGLRDEAVGRALTSLHAQPTHGWTLASLAKASGTSRSGLADRFNRLVGQPPMQYLMRWRMQLAAQLLSDGWSKVGAVAAEVGYDSEAAFSRAFKKVSGVAPATWRRA
jgi:AraC-like DNA-binding protein